MNIKSHTTLDLIITGNEVHNESEEINALSDFYYAFNNREIFRMEQSWLNSSTISMNNPIGGIRRGWEEIGKGYLKIFSGKARVYVEFYDFTIHHVENMFFATGRERGEYIVDTISIPLFIRTTRIFTFHSGKWRQIHHHGSIDDPELLKKYQEAVLK